MNYWYWINNAWLIIGSYCFYCVIEDIYKAYTLKVGKFNDLSEIDIINEKLNKQKRFNRIIVILFIIHIFINMYYQEKFIDNTLIALEFNKTMSFTKTFKPELIIK